MKLFYFWVITLVTISLPHFSFGQIPFLKSYKIQNYTVSDGLSQGSVYNIVEDSLGFIWMSSHDGLNRFDGQRFKVFHENALDSNSIGGNNTIGIIPDQNGYVWIGSEKCLNRYNYNLNP